MNFKDYQNKARSTNIYPPENELLCHTLGLNGEAGEVADKIKKIIRDHKGIVTKEKGVEIVYELGDVLWYLANIACDLGISLEQVALMNIAKLADRKERNKLQGSGDTR